MDSFWLLTEILRGTRHCQNGSLFLLHIINKVGSFYECANVAVSDCILFFYVLSTRLGVTGVANTLMRSMSLTRKGVILKAVNKL